MADLDDGAVLNAYVGPAAGQAGPVDDDAAGDHQVISHRCSPSSWPDDALHLGVCVEAEVAAVATNAAELEAAERRFQMPLGGIDPDVAAPQLLRHPHGPGRVARVHVVVQAVV